MRIDDSDLAVEFLPGVGARPHRRRLPGFDGAQLAFGHLRHHPDYGVISNSEQFLARLRAHALDRGSLEHDAIARRTPDDGVWHLTSAYDCIDVVVGDSHVLEKAPRTNNGRPQGALVERRSARRGARSPACFAFDDE